MNSKQNTFYVASVLSLGTVLVFPGGSFATGSDAVLSQLYWWPCWTSQSGGSSLPPWSTQPATLCPSRHRQANRRHRTTRVFCCAALSFSFYSSLSFLLCPPDIISSRRSTNRLIRCHPICNSYIITVCNGYCLGKNWFILKKLM